MMPITAEQSLFARKIADFYKTQGLHYTYVDEILGAGNNNF